MTTPAELVAKHFPGRPGAAYFDTASIGLVPKEVSSAVADCYRALGAGTRGMATVRTAVDRTRALLAAEFGCADADISFMSSTGEVVNSVARAIEWHDGDEVVVLDGEFPTTRLPWTAIPGVRPIRASPVNGVDRLAGLLNAIGPRTRLVAVSHVCSFTGVRVDLDVLGEACAAVDALLLCDGAQAAGVLPVAAGAVDFYVASGYKWMLAGFGTAFLISKPEARQTLRPTLLGHGNEPPSTALNYGTTNLPGICALGAAAAVRDHIGRHTIMERTRSVARRVYEGVAALGLSPVADPTRHGAIVSLGGLSSAVLLADRLASVDVFVAERGGYLRVSPHFYTLDEEVSTLLEALARFS